MQRYAMLVIVGSMPYEEEDTFMPDEGEDTCLASQTLLSKKKCPKKNKLAIFPFFSDFQCKNFD